MFLWFSIDILLQIRETRDTKISLQFLFEGIKSIEDQYLNSTGIRTCHLFEFS